MRKVRGRKGFGAGLCFCVLVAVLLTACGDGSGSRFVFTGGMGKDEVFRIGSSVCTVSEMMVYLVNTRNQYEKVYGDQVWKVSRDGVTLEENVKETVLARMAQIKTMYLLAGSREISLDEKETARVEQAAEEYYSSLNDTEKELMGADQDVIRRLYSEYALADKVYQDIIRDVNPEISDDEARTITVQHILLRTYTVDAQGGRVPCTEETKREIYEKACGIRQTAAEEEQDFVELASRYSEDNVITYSFGKGETDSAFEQAAFALETGEVSQVIETGEGYHIIKCVSTFDRNQTDRNKLEIVEQRRREAFGQVYDAFVKTLARQLNTELWEQLTLLQDQEVTTWDFFDIYAKYFPD